MKKTTRIFLLLGFVLAVALASPLQLLATDAENTVLVMRAKESAEAHEIEIDVTVEENTGVCGMLLSLVYDPSVFTLTGLEYGPAFSSLSPIHTNTETAEGYGIYPFKITYLGEENDTSTGNMMTLRFRVKEGAPDGTYTITLQHERNQDVTYLKGNTIQTKNLLIDGARITISQDRITALDTENNHSLTTPSEELRLPLAVGGLVLLGGSSLLITLLIKRKQSKKWNKL